MKFTKRNGIIINSIQNTETIINHIYLSMIPIILLFILNNGLKSLLILIMCLFTSLISEYIIYILIKKKKNIKYIIHNNYAILTALIIFIFLPYKYNTILIFIIITIMSLIKIIQGGFFKYKISPYIFGILIITIYQNIYNIPYQNIIDKNNLYIYLYLASIIVSLLILVYKNSIKYTITFTYLISITVFSIIMITLNIITIKEFVINILLLNTLLPSTYLITDSLVTPLTKKGMIIYSIIAACLTITFYKFIPFGYSIPAIFIAQLLSKYIDNYTIYKSLK